MAAINRQPFGLLGFLGIKNGGEYPTDLASTLLPVADLVPWYVQSNIQLLRASPVNVTGVGFNTLATIPQGEAWAVVAANINSNAVLGAGVSLRGFVAAAQIDALAFNHVPLGSYAQMTVGEGFVSAGAFPRPYILGPGTLLGFFCSFIAAGPVACALTLQYARLEL